MAVARQTQIPLFHLISEVAALPLASEIALRQRVVSLDPFLTADGSTAELWRQGEAHLLRSFPGVSVDEAVAIRDRTWFRALQPLRRVPLHEYLTLLAERYLTAVGSVAHPWLKFVRAEDDRPETDSHSGGRTGEAEDRRAWRWMSFALPSDLLLAALRPEDPPTSIQLVSPQVRTMLREHGFAETHLHLGAAFDFPAMWAAATHRIGRYDLPPDKLVPQGFLSPGARLREGRDMAAWLIRACLVRLVLGAFVARQGPGCSGDLLAFLEQRLDQALHPGWGYSAAVLLLADALRDLRRGVLDPGVDFRALQRAYQSLCGPAPPAPRRLADVQRLDPLAQWFPAPPTAEGPSIELTFLGHALRYLKRCPHDQLFALLFWQVVRIRAFYFRYCIQRPLTPGLQYFIRFYERKGCVTRALEKVELESANRLCGAGRGLKSLEVRLSPRRSASVQRRELNTLYQRYRQLEPARQSRPEFGVVLHFLKSRGDPHDQGLPPAFDQQGAGDPAARANGGLFRYGGAFRKWRAQALAMRTMLADDPQLLRVLRGFDICRDETGIPAWVYAPLFRTLTRSAAQAARECQLPAWGQGMARLTAHVGEDFVHLLSGLRAMDEAVQHLHLAGGDRVGHGLALGVDPLLWASKTIFVPLPCEERWLDLVWEFQLHSRDQAAFHPQRQAAVEREIMALSRTIFGPSLGERFHSPHDAVALVNMLYEEEELAAVGFPDRPLPERPTPRQELLIEYLTSPQLFRRAREVKWVRTENEGEALAAIQQIVRRRFAEGGITIETNPISNLLVGDLGDLTSHPLWRLSPVGTEVAAPLAVCIGSDDPLPFVTNLPEEYQFLYDALILAGRTHTEARAWLERARLAGLEARFTLAP